MKVFISQGMNGKTEEEIKEQRESMESIVKQNHPDDEIEFIDSYFEDYDGSALKYIAKSIDLLVTADLVVFKEAEWNSYRGCRTEHKVAKEYEMNIEFV